jgi:hypothetical protein
VPVAAYHVTGRTRQVCIYEEAHGYATATGSGWNVSVSISCAA